MNKNQRGTNRRNREDEVIQAAIDVFWEKGYPEATMQDLAEAVGVLKGSLYYYVNSKEELLFHLFEVSHEQATEIMKQTDEMEADPLEKVERYIRDYVIWYLSNIRRVTVYHRDWRYLTDGRLAEVRKQRRTYDDFVRNLVTEAQDQGLVPRSVDPMMATFFILGAVTSLPDWYRPEGAFSPENIADIYGEFARSVLCGAGAA